MQKTIAIGNKTRLFGEGVGEVARGVGRSGHSEEGGSPTWDYVFPYPVILRNGVTKDLFRILR
jgi:hypothetical protein